jgi:arabinosyltransferase A/arabinosyltransferase B/arabinosyltransferase C
VALPARHWWRPRAVDLVVVTGLAGWAVIGPITVDDGYVAGIIRTRDENGYAGNLYRWLNAPEAPFGWFYELYHLGAQLSPATLGLRVPSTVLGLACWVLLSRALLPRLGAFAARPATGWVAAAVFGTWWLPFNLGLRSEPWIAVAGLVTLLAVERTVLTRRVLPLLLALLVAAAATAVAPTGIVAFTPLLAGLVPLLRALRQRPELTGLPLLVLLVAAMSSALLLAFGDQTLAAVAEGTRIRPLVAGDVPWHQEIERYTSLLTPESVEGALPRRVPVLLTLAGLGGLVWCLGRGGGAGLARGPVTRVAVTFGLSLVVLSFTPTKWTYHFGALAGVGSAVLVTALPAFSRRALPRSAPRALAAAAIGTAVVAVVGGLALAGRNQWPYVSNYAVTWSTIAPQVGGVPASTVVLAGGLLLAAVPGAAAAWALAADRPAALPRWLSRWLPAPGLLALGLVVTTVVLQPATVARAALEQRAGFSMAADSVAVLTGTSCGLADHLRVEPDPRAGLLAATGPGEMAAFQPAPVELAGVQMGGWAATGVGDPVRGRTPWYRLDAAADRLVVVTVSGQLGPGTSLTAEFARADGAALPPVGLADPPRVPAARDVRIAVPDAGADLVRISVLARRDPGTVPLAFSPPRSPHTRPMSAVLPPGTRAVVDWPVAFLYPCLEVVGTPQGTAVLPRWQVSTPTADDSGRISTTPEDGGPFVTPRALVRLEQLPVYLDGDPLRDIATLYRWVPRIRYGTPDVARRTEVVAGWQRHGHLRIPGVG